MSEVKSSTKESPEKSAQWIRYLPEAFGIQEAVRQSPFRWCVRESALWGIATGTTMTMHRFRMGSNPFFAVNIGFLTTFMVCIPSYYFCYRTRENKERLIELMMKANDFQEASEMPDEVPAGESHPFLEPAADGFKHREYLGHLPDRKEWQTQVPQQDAKDVFVETSKSRK
mmetsp:Transcript_12736/g.18733  ORF Transcript_12736/g.18733 Transcript_12736/m.18733 type:complete len:171 (+) Transcript_12736:171-683(+)